MTRRGEKTARSWVVFACLLASLAALAAVSITGCSSSGGSPASPTGIAITLSGDSVQLTRTITARATSTYARETPNCDWYVDGTLGGNAQTGTITQDNPATYTAPQVVPAGGDVTITAVARSDSSWTGSDTLDVLFTIKYVDASAGTDAASAGTWATPFKTVSYGLDRVDRGDTLHVRPGTYDQALGEEDSFQVIPGVTLRGSHRDSCFLVASHFYSVVGLYDASSLVNFTLDSSRDVANFGVIATGDSLLIKNVKFTDDYDHSAIRVHDPGSDALIEDCEILNLTNPGDERGFELIEGSHCTIRNCTISGWAYGIMITGDSDPLIEGCTITDNLHGVIIFSAAFDEPRPDLGGGARGSLGGNTIQGNTQCGITNQTDNTIWALYNTWDNVPPIEGQPYPCDIENTAAGSVVF